MTHADILADELTEEQLAVLQAVLASSTMDKAAEALNISRRTLYRLLEQPELATALRRARGQMLEQAVSKLQEEANEAVATLGSVMRDKRASAASKVKAAETVLQYAFRGSEFIDMVARVAELERVAHGLGIQQPGKQENYFDLS